MLQIKYLSCENLYCAAVICKLGSLGGIVGPHRTNISICQLKLLKQNLLHIFSVSNIFIVSS